MDKCLIISKSTCAIHYNKVLITKHKYLPGNQIGMNYSIPTNKSLLVLIGHQRLVHKVGSVQLPPKNILYLLTVKEIKWRIVFKQFT